MAEPPVRTCPSCGREGATFRSECPHCGDRYDRRLSRRARRRLQIGAGLLALAIVGALIPIFAGESERTGDERRATEARAVAAERARLTREQRPFHGRAEGLAAPAEGAGERRQLAYRSALLERLEGAILANARARIASGELKGSVQAVECGPLDRSRGAKRPERRLDRRRGAYDCVAEERAVVRGGEKVAALGIPYVASLDFARARWVLCKDNKVPGERGTPLAKVRIPAECIGAEGREAVGDGFAAD